MPGPPQKMGQQSTIGAHCNPSLQMSPMSAQVLNGMQPGSHVHCMSPVAAIGPQEGSVVVVDDVVVLVDVVVVVADGFLSDGTHSSRRWISVRSSGPNWLFVNTSTPVYLVFV